MAQNVFFKKGLLANLPESYSAGTFYVTTDERAMYLDIDDSTRIRLGDFIQVAAVANLPTEGASTSALYYCVAENILAKWDGSEWTQINKQPSADEMKVLLGLGTMAYKSEVAEGDLNADLAAKINAASGAQHTHTFVESELNKIADGDVAKWNAAEQNAKDYADGLNTAMNGRVEALEAIDHSHTFVESELNKIVDGDVAKWNTAAEKAHTHTFNETELNKIVEGDVAKWNATAADHLTAEDKTALENAIKEAKKAGTDANTNIETYKVANDARVLAVEEDVAEITDGTNGILAQAKSYVDGKDSAMNTRVAALETAAPTHALKTEVEAVDAKFANYNTTVAQKAIDDAQDAEIAKKVAKTDYEADKATFATKTELGDVDAKFAGYRTFADQDVIDNGHKERIEALEAKFTGDNSVDAKIAAAVKAEEDARKEAVKGVQDEVDALEGRMDTAEGKITALETASATHATKDELAGVDAKFADYNTTEAQKAIDDAQDARIKAIEDDYLVEADIAEFETKANVKKVADDLAAYVEANNAAVADRYTKEEADGKFALITDAYDDEEVRGLISDNADAIAAETERATGIEAGLGARIKAVEDDYLKAADKTALQEQITANATAINVITNGIDAEKIDGLNDLIEWADEHAPEVKSIKEGIEANAKAISDHETLAATTYETKDDATSKKTEIDGRLDALEGKVDVEKVSTAISDAVKAEADRADGAYDTKGSAADAQAAAIADAAEKYETKGTAQGIVDALKLSETYEPIGAETRAIAAAKTETESQVKALADGQVATNATNIADLFAQMQWGEF